MSLLCRELAQETDEVLQAPGSARVLCGRDHRPVWGPGDSGRGAAASALGAHVYLVPNGTGLVRTPSNESTDTWEVVTKVL